MVGGEGTIRLAVRFFISLVSLVVTAKADCTVSLTVSGVPALSFRRGLACFILLFISFYLVFFKFSGSLSLAGESEVGRAISIFEGDFLVFVAFTILLILTGGRVVVDHCLFILSLVFFVKLSLLGECVSGRMVVFRSNGSGLIDLANIVAICDHTRRCAGGLGRS